MQWSYRIARIAGIDVRIHITFLLLPAYFGFVEWRAAGPGAAAQSVFFILLLFCCVLLHEFGHALAGRRYGIRTPDITLLPIGGVARMLAIPDKPTQEFVIAVAGPAVNVAIAAILAPVLYFTGGVFSGPLTDTRLLLHNLLLVNLGLVAFNMIPAFPMDGGRVLRSLLAMRWSWIRATRIAARTGQAIAILFALAALWRENPILLLIAFFVFSGARQEILYANYREELEHQPPPLPPENWQPPRQ
jgi:stage IV sporulation protein FB